MFGAYDLASFGGDGEEVIESGAIGGVGTGHVNEWLRQSSGNTFGPNVRSGSGSGSVAVEDFGVHHSVSERGISVEEGNCLGFDREGHRVGGTVAAAADDGFDAYIGFVEESQQVLERRRRSREIQRSKVEEEEKGKGRSKSSRGSLSKSGGSGSATPKTDASGESDRSSLTQRIQFKLKALKDSEEEQ
ncbi:UNVERIFIED_CONTAM: hypothetical protein HDU68_012473 [Siphonaria sp. JEL0065]|nr:hypothetical protein HDU68_012473 [Siphonaria sp. JEL0065]